MRDRCLALAQGRSIMKRTSWLLAFLLVGCLGAGLSRPAQATTMTATVCAVFANPCPLGSTIDAGLRTNFVGTLGFNQYALLPFNFTDANTTLTGTVLAADILQGANNWIYLFGEGVGSQSALGNGFFLDAAITQNYQTLGGIGSFSAFNIGSCNAAGTAAADGEVVQPFVNGTPLTGAGTTACSPFAQGFGPQAVASGGATNMTAAAIFQFNVLAGGGAAITLPWGGDLPDPDLGFDPTTGTLPQLLSDLQDAGLTQQDPEPATFAMFGAALLVLACVRRRIRSNG
jgi:hypothetical protein